MNYAHFFLAQKLEKLGNSLLWEVLIPFDYSQPWDFRGSYIFFKILERSQHECSNLLKSGEFYKFASEKQIDLVIVDHFLQVG